MVYNMMRQSVLVLAKVEAGIAITTLAFCVVLHILIVTVRVIETLQILTAIRAFFPETCLMRGG